MYVKIYPRKLIVQGYLIIGQKQQIMNLFVLAQPLCGASSDVEQLREYFRPHTIMCFRLGFSVCKLISRCWPWCHQYPCNKRTEATFQYVRTTEHLIVTLRE